MLSDAAIVLSGFVMMKFMTGIARSVMTSIVWGNPMSTPHFKASWTASGLEAANDHAPPTQLEAGKTRPQGE